MVKSMGNFKSEALNSGVLRTLLPVTSLPGFPDLPDLGRPDIPSASTATPRSSLITLLPSEMEKFSVMETGCTLTEGRMSQNGRHFERR